MDGFWGFSASAWLIYNSKLVMLALNGVGKQHGAFSFCSILSDLYAI